MVAAGFSPRIGQGKAPRRVATFERLNAFDLSPNSHHRLKTFEQECRTVLDKHGIQYDERHLFDGEFAG